MGLVMGCDGFVAGCSAHSLRQVGRGFASVLISSFQLAGVEAASDSPLGAIRRNGFGAGDSLFPRPSGSETLMELMTGPGGSAPGPFRAHPPLVRLQREVWLLALHGSLLYSLDCAIVDSGRRRAVQPA